MSHFGPKVIGQAAYDAIVAQETASEQHHFGSRVTGSKVAPAPKISTEGTAFEVLAQLKAGAALRPLIDAELARDHGRPTVVKALMSAGAKANLAPELLDRLGASLDKG